jgi:hypothetical protein
MLLLLTIILNLLLFFQHSLSNINFALGSISVSSNARSMDHPLCSAASRRDTGFPQEISDYEPHYSYCDSCFLPVDCHGYAAILGKIQEP